MCMTAAEDRATRGRDPSAVCGTNTQGWAARAPPFRPTPLRISTKAVNPSATQSPRLQACNCRTNDKLSGHSPDNPNNRKFHFTLNHYIRKRQYVGRCIARF